ncbi:MAG: hypothetical protein ACFFEE_12665 [Candidatus Thorarchaeota archaeon]
MQIESTILYYSLTIAGLFGQILSVLLVIALIFPLKGSTRSIVYALGSAISFFIGGFIVIFVSNYQYSILPTTHILRSFPSLSSIEIVVGWHNLLGVICGYILLIIAIIQYRRDHTKQLQK